MIFAEATTLESLVREIAFRVGDRDSVMCCRSNSRVRK
jgi:hypothetical protein